MSSTSHGTSDSSYFFSSHSNSFPEKGTSIIPAEDSVKPALAYDSPCSWQPQKHGAPKSHGEHSLQVQTCIP